MSARRHLQIMATPGFEYLDGTALTLNGKRATVAQAKKLAGDRCGICGGTEVRSFVSFVLARPDLRQALAECYADGKLYPICTMCEALGQEVFLPAMERRLRADLMIEGPRA